MMVNLMKRAGDDDVSVVIPVRREQAAVISHLGSWLVMPKGPEPAKTFDRMVPVDGGEIRVQIMTPAGPGPHPLYVFLHGGGWCVGTLHERAARCRAVSAGAHCVVASVDYRMAPENKYPVAPEDCYAALCWLVDNAAELGIDPTRVAIGGESAGGNLAAAVCLMARDRNGPAICHQWLDVPAVDATLSQSGHREVPDGYLLDAAALDDFLVQYLSDPDQAKEPYCSPLLADDLSGLPPAWIGTMEFDKLRGDGEAYAAALNDAGVPARHVRLAGHIHPSFAFTRVLKSARDYERDAIAALRAAFTA
jgi:acetyl esterase